MFSFFCELQTTIQFSSCHHPAHCLLELCPGLGTLRLYFTIFYEFPQIPIVSNKNFNYRENHCFLVLCANKSKSDNLPGNHLGYIRQRKGSYLVFLPEAVGAGAIVCGTWFMCLYQTKTPFCGSTFCPLDDDVRKKD